MNKLNQVNRNFLRSRAHHMSSIIIIGKQGVSERAIKSIDAALNQHELIKIKFSEFKTRKKVFSGRPRKRFFSGIILN